LLPGDVDVAEYFLVLRLRGHGSDLRIQAHRIAHARGPREREQLVDESIVDVFLQQQARTGDASLPGRGENTGNGSVDRILELGVGKYNVGRLAAQLEAHVLEGLRGKLVDRPAGGIRARKGDLLHQRVLDKRSTYFLAEAGDHVHHTVRESRLLDQLDAFQRRGR